MGLFLPTSGTSTIPFSSQRLSKAQIYCLDTNEFLNFQFNPSTFQWERDINWAETNWRNNDFGGDIEFINSGPRTFDLPLLYIADPGAPDIEYQPANNATAPGGRKDFEFIESLFERWASMLPAKKRPSRVRVMFGPRSFEGVIVHLDHRIVETFEDLSVREGLITVSFREWKIIP